MGRDQRSCRDVASWPSRRQTNVASTPTRTRSCEGLALTVRRSTTINRRQMSAPGPSQDVNKCSAVAEAGDRLATIDIGRKLEAWIEKNDPTNSVKALKEVVVLRTGFNPTRSTSPCYKPTQYTCMQYIGLSKNESKHSEMWDKTQSIEPRSTDVRGVFKPPEC